MLLNSDSQHTWHAPKWKLVGQKRKRIITRKLIPTKWPENGNLLLHNLYTPNLRTIAFQQNRPFIHYFWLVSIYVKQAYFLLSFGSKTKKKPWPLCELSQKNHYCWNFSRCCHKRGIKRNEIILNIIYRIINRKIHMKFPVFLENWKILFISVNICAISKNI